MLDADNCYGDTKQRSAILNRLMEGRVQGMLIPDGRKFQKGEYLACLRNKETNGVKTK